MQHPSFRLPPPTGIPIPTPLYLKFRTSHRENIRYLKTIGIIDPKAHSEKLPSPQSVDQILLKVNILKSKGLRDADLPRIAFLNPQIFSNLHQTSQIESVFDFFITDLQASEEESLGLVVNCPQILSSHVEFCLQPTLDYLRQLGLQKLNVPSKRNAVLLNTRVDKLRPKIKFLRSIGLSKEEAPRFCARMPAIFGYNVDDNLRPKFEFLVEEMERSLEELIQFPQYFGFSLRGRIVPRHWHLKQRSVRIKLNRMLLWSDERFFAKWK